MQTSAREDVVFGGDLQLAEYPGSSHNSPRAAPTTLPTAQAGTDLPPDLA